MRQNEHKTTHPPTQKAVTACRHSRSFVASSRASGSNEKLMAWRGDRVRWVSGLVGMWVGGWVGGWVGWWVDRVSLEGKNRLPPPPPHGQDYLPLKGGRHWTPSLQNGKAPPRRQIGRGHLLGVPNGSQEGPWEYWDGRLEIVGSA